MLPRLLLPRKRARLRLPPFIAAATIAAVAFIIGASSSDANESNDEAATTLEFTSAVYNLTISERWSVNATAWSDGELRVGVRMPAGYTHAKFKIVAVGVFVGRRARALKHDAAAVFRATMTAFFVQMREKSAILRFLAFHYDPINRLIASYKTNLRSA